MDFFRSFWRLGFFELWHPVMLLVLIVIAFIYIRAVKQREKRVSKSKLFFFISGLFILYLSEGSPLKALGHHFLFTAHMMSMSLTYFAVPPLILGGLYHWMVVPLFKLKGLKKFLNFITHPLLAVSLFNILISFYHIPTIFNWIMVSDMRMMVANIILLFFAFVMWWLIVQPPMVHAHKLKPMEKIFYVFAASILLTPACAMIMFANHFIYDTTAAETQLFSFLSPLEDQKSGGVVMKIIQEIVFIGALGHIFYQWSKKDRDSGANDLNPKPGLLLKQK
ncbi:cytochrome c oxidase assembly protein [Camelliibacillus cellulosilyticus]|uniref:Cytochrome c oxidase assembly protein n=1 Tax=Camelliibacillus cellulosilyticus TaxID=2174486 RepID=A0ABV9GKB2_9BACL